MLIVSFPIFVFAQENTTNNVSQSYKVLDKQKIQDYWDKLNIDRATQKKLLDKINRGEILDSENPEKVKAVAEKLTISKKKPYAEYTFPDGSKIRRQATETDVVVSPMNTVIYKNITVYEETTLQACSYPARIRIDMDYPNSGIVSVGPDYSIVVLGGTFSNANLAIIRYTQSGSLPAYARCRWEFTYAPGGYVIGSGTGYCYLYVKDLDWWSSISC